MLVCVANGFVVFRTYFDKKYDLIQKFRGLSLSGALETNNPVDFMESGLMQRDKWDYWHIDKPFAINTDEAVPAFVNGCYIGANHGHHGAVSVYAPDHGKTLADVGSRWKDDAGTVFTLMRVSDPDYLLFLSENVGDTTDNYAFVAKIEGTLVYLENGENKAGILPLSQGTSDLRRAVRYKKKEVVVFVDGQERRLRGSIDCDYAEIREEYEIINPATVAEALRKNRPVGGYAVEPDLAAFGEPMIDCKLTYRVEKDGTIFTIFDYKRLIKVHFSKFMGVMYQEKLDVYGGGIWRYFPKILPFETAEGRFDFSNPTLICNAPFPHDILLSREYWQDNGSPCERVVDYFRDRDGADKLAFACGFLPILDGKPALRNKRVSNLVQLIFTRKHYPIFVEGDIATVKGIGYKKYFTPEKNKAAYYTVPFDGKTYIYVDIFEKNALEIPVAGGFTLLEKGGDVKYAYENGVLSVSGKKGFAVFVVDMV